MINQMGHLTHQEITVLNMTVNKILDFIDEHYPDKPINEAFVRFFDKDQNFLFDVKCADFKETLEFAIYLNSEFERYEHCQSLKEYVDKLDVLLSNTPQ